MRGRSSGIDASVLLRKAKVLKNLISKITLAAIVFGIASMDDDYSPFGSIHNALSAFLVLALIFFGDTFVRWLARK